AHAGRPDDVLRRRLAVLRARQPARHRGVDRAAVRRLRAAGPPLERVARDRGALIAAWAIAFRRFTPRRVTMVPPVWATARAPRRIPRGSRPTAPSMN